MVWPAPYLDAVLPLILAAAIVIHRRHPDLIAERPGPRKGARRWDLAYMSGHGLFPVATFTIAGFDHRHWVLSLGYPGGVADHLSASRDGLMAP